MAFPTDGYTASSVMVIGSAGVSTYRLSFELDGEVATETFVADIEAAVAAALAVASPMGSVDTTVIYTGQKNV